MSPTLRIIGDVHAQIEHADLFTRDAQPYLDIIADTPHSVQLGDMGDRATYEQLVARVDAGRHRFFRVTTTTIIGCRHTISAILEPFSGEEWTFSSSVAPGPAIAKS
jgi:hypothetical protein